MLSEKMFITRTQNPNFYVIRWELMGLSGVFPFDRQGRDKEWEGMARMLESASWNSGENGTHTTEIALSEDNLETLLQMKTAMS